MLRWRLPKLLHLTANLNLATMGSSPTSPPKAFAETYNSDSPAHETIETCLAPPVYTMLTYVVASPPCNGFPGVAATGPIRLGRRRSVVPRETCIQQRLPRNPQNPGTLHIAFAVKNARDEQQQPLVSNIRPQQKCRFKPKIGTHNLNACWRAHCQRWIKHWSPSTQKGGRTHHANKCLMVRQC